MNFPRVIMLFSVFLGCSAALQLPDKHPLDETKTKTLILKNGLKISLFFIVYLIYGCLQDIVVFH